MKMTKHNLLKQIIPLEIWTPKGFVVRAAIIALFFAVCHLLGWREHTSFLCGTTGSTSAGGHLSAVLGVIYIVAYLGFVLVAPMLVLAASILFGLERFWTAKHEKS